MDYQTTRQIKPRLNHVLRVIVLLAVLFSTSACSNLNLPASIFGPTATPTPTVTPTPTLIPTATATPTTTPTPTPTPLPTPMILVASTNMYKPINLYQDPDAHSEVAGTLEPGVIVPVIEMSEDGLWLKVGFDPVGWVSVAQVALTGSMYTKPDTASKRQGVIQSDTAVNVRSGPGTTFRVLGQIKAGQVVVTLDQSTDGQWVQVQFKGGDGWVAVSTVIMAGGEPTLTPVVTEETTREP